MVRKDQKILIKQNKPKKPRSDPDPNKKLTKKQKAFVKEYMVDRNGAQAAIRAGYSKNGSHVIASNLLSKINIKCLVDAEQENQNIRLEISADATLREINRLAQFDPRKLYIKDAEGNRRRLEIWELDDDTAACISGLEETVTYPKAAHLEKKVITKLLINQKGPMLKLMSEIQKLVQAETDGNPPESVRPVYVTKSARREKEAA